MTAVLVGGDEVWEHVLDGTYPDRGIAKQEGPEYTEEEKKRIEQLEEEFLRYKLMADEAKKKYESISRELGGRRCLLMFSRVLSGKSSTTKK